MEVILIMMGVVIVLHLVMDSLIFFKEYGPKQAKRKYKKKRKLPEAIAKKRGKMSGWTRRKISEGQKKYWSNMTPEQKRIMVDKLHRARALKRLLKEKGNA